MTSILIGGTERLKAGLSNFADHLVGIGSYSQCGQRLISHQFHITAASFSVHYTGFDLYESR